ncbi:hypothetical protein GCM10022224_029680 [Nonomuraea antimicrobica]|uniref:MinD-like ATPase involved in chromosome partitioning or flagellar assembly n=1 Tax=Nonomuraea antimicrobica TaxID=561173 RepID=A0ABP7BMV5_9ACTN
MDLPTYTNIWRIEKRLYKLYDLRLPMPLPIVWIGVFVGVFVPWSLLLVLVGVPVEMPWHVLFLVPPGIVTWLSTRPVIEGKRLTELMESQLRYLGQPKAWYRLAATSEPETVTFSGRVWRTTPARAKAKGPRKARHAQRRREGQRIIAPRQVRPAVAAAAAAAAQAPVAEPTPTRSGWGTRRGTAPALKARARQGVPGAPAGTVRREEGLSGGSGRGLEQVPLVEEAVGAARVSGGRTPVERPRPEPVERTSAAAGEATRERAREATRGRAGEAARGRADEATRGRAGEARESGRVPVREPVREPGHEAIRELAREPAGEPVREPAREPVREAIREPARESARAANFELPPEVVDGAGDEVRAPTHEARDIRATVDEVREARATVDEARDEDMWAKAEDPGAAHVEDAPVGADGARRPTVGKPIDTEALRRLRRLAASADAPADAPGRAEAHPEVAGTHSEEAGTHPGEAGAVRNGERHDEQHDEQHDERHDDELARDQHRKGQPPRLAPGPLLPGAQRAWPPLHPNAKPVPWPGVRKDDERVPGRDDIGRDDIEGDDAVRGDAVRGDAVWGEVLPGGPSEVAAGEIPAADSGEIAVGEAGEVSAGEVPVGMLGELPVGRADEVPASAASGGRSGEVPVGRIGAIPAGETSGSEIAAVESGQVLEFGEVSVGRSGKVPGSRDIPREPAHGRSDEREDARERTTPAGRESARERTTPAGREGAQERTAATGREGARERTAAANREGAREWAAQAGREAARERATVSGEVAPTAAGREVVREREGVGELVAPVPVPRPGEARVRRIESVVGRDPGGWRRIAQVVVGGGGVRTDGSEIDEARARSVFGGGRRIVVLGCTGGAGQSTTALMLGHTFAHYRDDRVVAVDANTGGGTLTSKIQPETPETLTSLMSGLDRVSGYLTMRGYTTRTASGLEVISADTDAGAEQRLADRSFFSDHRLGESMRLLDRHYKLAVIDPAAALAARLLPYADQLVLVVPASEEASEAVAMTYEWLDGHGCAELRRRAVMVVNGVSRRSMTDVEQAESMARGRCRAIVRVPWEDGLAPDGGEVVDPGQLRAAGRRAYLALAGVVVAGFAAQTVRPSEEELASDPPGTRIGER